MYAKSLERVLATLCEKSDLTYTLASEYEERFRSLRGFRCLPMGRESRQHILSNIEIARAIFGLISVRPSWAGHAALILGGLRPVGGMPASFFSAETLEAAVALLIESKNARSGFVRLRLTVSETGVNSSGGGELIYVDKGERRVVHFVPKEAVSLLQPGREADYDPEDRLTAPVMREMSFDRDFFSKLARECELSRLFPKPLAGDGAEYNFEEVQQERRRKLGIRPSSRFLNIGADNQVTWPREETVIKFDEYDLVLMPKTKDNVQSVHIDLSRHRLSDREAVTVINRFLSVMAWCDDNFAISQGGWSANAGPAAVSRQNLSFVTASHYIFDRRIPRTDEARRALALYREARNAQHSSLVGYAVLNYYKIIGIKYHHKESVRRWFRENFSAISSSKSEARNLDKFLELCGSDAPDKYIHDSCRIAVAHAGQNSKSDPDESHEIFRLHIAAAIMRLFARRFIKIELSISDSMYSGE